MIQRIQTVYLFFVAVFMLAAFFLPILEVVKPGGVSTVYNLFSLGAYSFLPAVVSPAISLLVGVMAIITIFLYKRRKLQINFCIWMLVLMLLLYAMVLYAYSTLTSRMSDNATFFPEIALLFPLLAIILDCMAIAGIRKDQKTVKALDRLR